jgi:integrase/recombinase XerD
MRDGEIDSNTVFGYAKRRLPRLKTTENNRQTILRFMDFGFSEGLSPRRVEKYLCSLSKLAVFLNMDFDKAGRPDIERVMNVIERSDYTDWTKHDFKITLKKFYRWLRNTEENPPEVKWIRTTLKNCRLKLPKDILSPVEIRRLIVAALSDRDRAFVSVLYESGCRIGELLSLRMRQLQRHKHGYQITVDGKTGSRRLLLIASAQYISTWLNHHPSKDEPDSYLWTTATYRNKKLTYSRICDILKTTARRANIKKAVNPHNFRHSRATHLAKHLTEAQMKEFFGWVQASDMAATYVHLSGRDMDNALLKLHNIPIPEEDSKEDDFSLKTCRRCDLSNPPANKYCNRCGMVLDQETADLLIKKDLERQTADEILDTLLNDKEFKEILIRKAKVLDTRKP